MQAVYEKSLGRFGLEIIDPSDSKRKMVAWSSSSAPVERITSGPSKPTLINIPVPSVRFLKYAATDHLDEIWATNPQNLICLALSEASPGGTSARELFGYLSSQPHPLGVKDAGEILKVLKELETDGRAKGKITTKSGPTNATKYSLLGDFEACLPEDYLWLLSYRLPVTTTRKTASVAEQKTPKAKKPPANRPSVTIEPSIEISALEHFQHEVRGDRSAEPEGYLHWLRDPWSAAAEMQRSIRSDGSWSIRKAASKHYPVISMVNPELLNASDRPIHKKAVLSNLVPIMAKSSQKQLEELSWLKRLLLSESKLDLSGKDALDVLIAAAALRSLVGSENKISDYVIGHILKDESFRKTVLEAKKRHGDKDVAKAFEGLMLETGFDEGRYALALRGVRDFRLQVDAAQILEGASLRQALDLLSTDLVKIDAQRPHLLGAVSHRLNQLIPGLTKVTALTEVLEVVERFGLEIDPEHFGRAFRKSLTGSTNARYLAGSIFDESRVLELEEEVAAITQVSATQAIELRAVSGSLSEAQNEIKRLKTASTASRQQQEDMTLHDLKAARLPIIRAMARALAASHELLFENPHSISRLEIIAEQVGLRNVGRVGEKIEFDLTRCEDPAGTAHPGDIVEVQNVGYTWDDGVDEVLILKAVVISK